MTVRRHVLLVAPLVAAALYGLGCFLPSEPSGARRITFALSFPQPLRLRLADTADVPVSIFADGKPLSNPTYRLETLNRWVVQVSSTGRGLRGVGRDTATVRVVYETVNGMHDTTFAVKVVVAGVAMDRPYLTFSRIADTVRLQPTAYDAKDQPVVGVTFAWSSQTPQVASVDSTGLVTALNDGSSIIMAEADGEIGSTGLQVSQEAAAVMMLPKLDTLHSLLRTARFLARALDDTNGVIHSAKPHFASTNPTVATVGDTSGVATSVGAGSTRIIARVGDATDTATLFVVQAVRLIAVKPLVDTLTAIGDTVRHSVLAFDSANQEIANPKVTWATSDTSIVVVDSAGLARAVRNGFALIMASADGQSGLATAVVHQEVASVQIGPDAVSLTRTGDTVRLVAEGRDRNGYAVAPAVFDWRSGSECVATVTDGLVTAVSDGVAWVSAAPLVGGSFDSVMVTVTGAEALHVQIAYGSGGGIAGLCGEESGKILIPHRNEVYVGSPSWAPSGLSLAFSGFEVPGQNIYTSSADGSVWRAITDWREVGADSQYDDYPAWSPDGSRIAFVRSSAVSGSTVMVATADGLTVRLLRSCSSCYDPPAWSPDGTKLAFADAGSIYVMNSADGTGVIRLMQNAGAPAWSPDGSQIAFNREGTLWLMNADGTAAKSLLGWGGMEGPPSWSPDGSRLVFALSDGEQADLHVINRDGTGLRQLTSTYDDSESMPVWRPAPQLSGPSAAGRTRAGHL